MKVSLVADGAAIGVVVSATVLDVRPETALFVRFAEGDERRLGVARAGKIRAVFTHFAASGENVSVDAAIEPASPGAWIDGVELLGIEEGADDAPPVAGATLLVERRIERPNETVLEITVRSEGARPKSNAAVRIGVRPASPIAFIPSTVAAFVGDRAPVVVDLSTPLPERALDVELPVGVANFVRIVGTQPLEVGRVRCIALSKA